MGTVKSKINRGRAQISKKIGECIDMGTSFWFITKRVELTRNSLVNIKYG